MFHRSYFLAVFVYVFSRRLVANELLTSDRVLAFREPLEVLLADLAAQSPLFGKSSVPLAMYLVAFRVVVLAGIRRTLPRDTPVPGLRSGDWRWSALWLGLLEEVFLSRPGSFQLMFAVLAYFVLREFLFQPHCAPAAAAAAFGRFLRSDLRRSLDVPRMLTRQVRRTGNSSAPQGFRS